MTKAQKPPTASSSYKNRGKRVKAAPVQFTPSLLERIDAAVIEHGYESRSALIREAADDYIKRLGKRKAAEQ